jgi:NADH-quinone oxidoreductase subunit H
VNFWIDPIGLASTWLMGLFLSWGLAPDFAQILVYFLGAGVLATGAMVFTVFLIWLERKLIGRFQDRFGPNRVGPFGIFQTIADMLKIFIKEFITPDGADIIPYNLAPILAVAGVLFVWAVLPFAINFLGVNLNVGALYVVAAGAIGELGIILAGWGSNNKYALLGAFRAIGQMISYEVPMILTLLIPVMFAGSMGLNDIVKAQQPWFILLAPMAAFIFFITLVAENARAPFDLIEADSGIVAGINIEYSGLKFGMFYVADFLHCFTISVLFTVLFLGGWQGPKAEQYPWLGFLYTLIKTSVVYFIIIWLRAGLPRFRIDQVMDINWKLLTPLAIAVLAVTAIVDKTLAQSSMTGRILGLLAANLLMLLITLRFLRVYAQRKRRPLVVPSAAVELPDSVEEALS